MKAQEKTPNRSENFKAALEGIEQLENHLEIDYSGAIKKAETEEDEQFRSNKDLEKHRKLEFLKDFKERLILGKTVATDINEVFTMYFGMIIGADGFYDKKRLDNFMGNLIIAAKESGSYFIKLPSKELEGQDIPEITVKQSIQETRDKFGL